MSKSAVMMAETVGAAARHDPQLQVPVRPRVRRGLTTRVEGNELLVYGGPKRQRFQGRSAIGLLPRLLEQLSGERTHDDLAVAVGASEDVVFKSLSLLWTCGVIEEGPATAPPIEPVADDLADFLSRIGDSTAMNASWELAAARLQAARVEVIGPDALTAGLVDALEPSLRCRSAGNLPTADATLVLLVDDGATDTAAAARFCWDNDIRMARLRLTGRSAELGPFVDPSLTACLNCLSSAAADDVRPPRRGDHDLAVALFARDIFALVSRSTPAPLASRWRRVDLADLTHEDLSGSTRAGCPNCSAASGPLASEAPLAVRYEASVAMPAKEFADLKAHQMHYKASNLALQREARTWPAATGVPLPEPATGQLDRAWGAAADDEGKVSLESISLLLMGIAGLRGTDHAHKVQRWTASGGNIGSCSVYLVVRDCPGIAPGVYGYISPSHSLARLSAEVPAFTGGGPVSLVLTGDYRKVAEKYAAFALRIVFLDAGCAQATGRLVAETLSLSLRFRPTWDDQEIAASLGLDLDIEPITAVGDLGGKS